MLAAQASSPTALRRTTLDNGLTVLVQPMRTSPLASVWCWYAIGSADERPGLTGISHWVEHMNFKGTRNIPRDQVKGLIEQCGGSWNGYTWIDQTTYFETASRTALDRMLFIEAERMASSLFEDADFESERTVIISELQGGENDPDQVLETEVTAAAFKAHGYRHPTIGWLGDIETMTRNDLYEHYRRWYVPNNAAVVVVGDVETDEVLRRVERWFGGIAPGRLPERRRTPEPPQLGERRVVVRKAGTTAYLKLAWRAPAVTDPDFHVVLVLDAVLSGAKGANLWALPRHPPQRSSRLYRALVDRGLASSVSGIMLPTRDPFLYTISCTASDGTPLATLEAATLEALEAVRDGGLEPSEVARAQRQLRARLVFESDSVTNVAHQLGYFTTVADLTALHSMSDRLGTVTAEDVSRAARRYLTPGSLTVGWFQPEPTGNRS